MASDITITSLTAVGGLGQVALSALTLSPLGMTCLAYMQPAAVQFWGAATNNRNAATLIATSDVGFTVHGGLPDAATRYYWARAVDPEGNFGPYYPASATAGVSASTKTATPGPNSITEEMIQDGAVSKEKFVAGITPVEIVSSLPSTGNYVGRMVYFSGKLYRHTGSPSGSAGFTAAVPSVDITGQITHQQISTPNLAALSANLGTVTAGTLTSNVAYLGAVSAAQISTTDLSAISANLGTITAGSVTGVTFTGGLFRTSATGRRIEIDSATNRLTAYNANGTPIAWINDTGIGTGAMRSNGTEAEPRAASFTSNTTAGTEDPAVRIARLGAANAPGLDVSANNQGSYSHSIRFFNAGSAGQGAIGVSVASGGYAFLSTRGGYGPFTGAHDAFVKKDATAEIGDIVCDLRVLARNGISDTVTEVSTTDLPASPAVAGVVAARVGFDETSLISALPEVRDGQISPIRKWLAERFDRLTINGVGEGQVNVCGRNGDIAVGDYITTSTMPGKGQRQDDDIKRSCTVARAREAVTFSDPDQVKRVACFYECG